MCWCRRRCATILAGPTNRIQGFLAAGHVCTVMGFEEYVPIAAHYHVPIVVTGFEPLDILEGVYMSVRQLEEGRAEVENQYSRSVKRDGNRPAQAIMAEVFQVTPRRWRGIGDIAESGLGLVGRLSPISTPNAASGRCRPSRRRKPSASAAWCCAARRSRPSARPSARAARRSTRSG